MVGFHCVGGHSIFRGWFSGGSTSRSFSPFFPFPVRCALLPSHYIPYWNLGGCHVWLLTYTPPDVGIPSYNHLLSRTNCTICHPKSLFIYMLHCSDFHSNDSSRGPCQSTNIPLQLIWCNKVTNFVNIKYRDFYLTWIHQWVILVSVEY